MNLRDALRFAPRFLRAYLSGGRMPVQMHIRVIDRCNLHCRYCFGDYPVRNLPPPSTGQLFEVLDGLGRMGTLRVTLTGGEPLLRDDIHQIVRRARRNRIEPSLTTNGVLIDQNLELLDDLNQLTVSLDGGRAEHDAFRGEGSWDHAVHAVEVARGRGTPVQLLCTVTRLSRPGLDEVFEVADRYDCAVTFDLLAPLYRPDGSQEIREQNRSDDDMRALLESLLARKSKRAVYSRYVLRYVRNWPLSFTRYRLFSGQLPAGFRPIPCRAGQFFGLIETDGSLIPCCRTGAEYRPPNVYELGVEEAWKRMPEHHCAACVQIGGNMFNALLSLNPSTLRHYIMTTLRLPPDKGWREG